MVIGFSQRSQTVIEDGTSGFTVPIHLHAMKPSHMKYVIMFHINETSTTATVGARNDFGVDAVFGNLFGETNILEESLSAGATELDISTFIVNDDSVETTECFTIGISNHNDCPMFKCYEDYTGSGGAASGGSASNEDDANYFCQHTICIEDNDGLLHFSFCESLLMHTNLRLLVWSLKVLSPL